jgi:hypothetical protein
MPFAFGYQHLHMVTFGDKIYRQSSINPYGKSPTILWQERRALSIVIEKSPLKLSV